MYQALYRKYRPRRFCDVAGQGHITETLRSQIVSNRLSHAYLFVGTRGTGKTTCARILSRAVNCLSPAGGNPCNECLPCMGIENGTILDVLEIDAASNNGVDDVRALRDEAIYSPASVKKRVYIIDEVHMLSTPAFNALLKVLEEPPEHILFILATTELHKVPATIQSRCQRFMFRRLSLEEITGYLNEIAAGEELSLAPEAAEKLAILADGSMRDAISLLDQCASKKSIDLAHVQDTLGLAAEEELLHLVKAISENNVVAVLDTVDRFYKNGKDLAALLGELSGILRDLLVVRLTPDSALIDSGVSRSELAAMSELFSAQRLLYCLEVAKDALLNLSRTGISKAVLELCLIRMVGERLADESAVPTPEPAVKPTPPAPEPEEKCVNRTVPVTPAQEVSDDILSDILANIDDRSLLPLLSGSGKAQASYVDDVLVFTLNDLMSANYLKDIFMDTLSEAVRKTTGKDTVIRIETIRSGNEDDKQIKLDDLMAFGDIVKVE